MSTVTTLTPNANRLAVRRDDPVKVTEQGIILPESTKEKPKTGVIIGVGSTVGFGLKVGDHVVFGSYAGSEIKIGEESVLILNDLDVLGTLHVTTLPDDSAPTLTAPASN